MKNKAWILCLLICSMAVLGKHDGWYCMTVSDKVETPHVKWLTQTKPLKVLFIVSYEAARDVIELAQRMPMNHVEMITCKNHRLGATDTYEGALAGNSKAERIAEFRAKVSQRYDLIVCANYTLEIFPPDAVYRLLEQVATGTGLVVTGRRLPFKKLYATEHHAPELFCGTGNPESWNTANIKGYDVERGRLVQIAWPKLFWAHGLMLPNLPVSKEWRSHYENHMQALITAMNWAARRPCHLKTAVQREGSILKVQGAAPLEYRLRNQLNQILATGTVKNGVISLPKLPAGQYFCDLLSRGTHFNVHGFLVQSPLGGLQVKVENESVYDKGDIAGQVILERPAGTALSLRLELLDEPKGTIWYRRELAVPAGAKAVSFKLSKYTLPALVASLRATLGDGKMTSATGECKVYLPDVKLPDYFQYSWGNGTNPNYLHQLRDELGFTGAISYVCGSKHSLLEMAMKNIHSVGYFTRLALAKGANGGVTLPCQHLFDAELGRQLAKLGKDDLNINRPEVQEALRQSVDRKMAGLTRYGVMLYSLGDENCLDTEAGYGPSDLKTFRQFLKERYGSIARLNEEWQSQYASFDQVPHLKTSEALAQKNYPAWNDHVTYMEKMFTDLHAIYAKGIRRHDPRAQIGIEGTFGRLDMESLMNHLDWWGPYLNPVENEVLRSLYPERYRVMWTGYHDERGPGKYPVLADHLLKGTANGCGWYAAFLDSHSIIAVDYQPSFPPEYMNILERLRWGLAQVLIHNPLDDQGIRLYWSHASRRVVKTDSRFVTPESGVSAMLHYFYRSGLSGEFVTKNTLSRLKQAKILFLNGIAVMDDQEAKAIRQFVKDGGLVVADLFPGTVNEYMRFRDNSILSDLFGDIRLAEQKLTTVGPLNLKGIKADKVLLVPDQPLFREQTYGKGKAILLNFNLGLLETSAGTQAFDGFMNKLMGMVGIHATYDFTGEGLFRVRHGKGFDVIGFRAPNRSVEAGKVLRMQWEGEREIYECGSGYVGRARQLDKRLSNSPFHVYALFTERQQAPKVSLPASISAGETLRFDLSAHPHGRIVSIRMVNPLGKELKERNLVVNTARQSAWDIPLAYDDQKGTYCFVIQDVVTGLQTEQKVVVK